MKQYVKQYVKVCSTVPRKYMVFRNVSMNEILNGGTEVDDVM